MTTSIQVAQNLIQNNGEIQVTMGCTSKNSPIKIWFKNKNASEIMEIWLRETTWTSKGPTIIIDDLKEII